MSNLLNSATCSSAANDTDDTGQSNPSPFSVQSAALTPSFDHIGSLQGLHNMQGNFNFPSMADTYFSRNSTTTIIPSGSMQQSTENLVTGRFGSTNLPVVRYQMYEGRSHGLSRVTNTAGMNVTGRPAYNRRTNTIRGSIPGVLPTSAAVGNRGAVPGLGVSPILGNTGSHIAPSMGNAVGSGYIGRSFGGNLSMHGLAPRLNLNSTNSSGTLSLQAQNELMSGGLQQQEMRHNVSMLRNSYASSSNDPLSQSHVQAANNPSSMAMMNEVKSHDNSLRNYYASSSSGSLSQSHVQAANNPSSMAMLNEVKSNDDSLRNSYASSSSGPLSQSHVQAANNPSSMAMLNEVISNDNSLRNSYASSSSGPLSKSYVQAANNPSSMAMLNEVKSNDDSLRNTYASSSGGPLSQSHVQAANNPSSMAMLNEVKSKDDSLFHVDDFPSLSTSIENHQSKGAMRRQGFGASTSQKRQQLSIPNEDIPALPELKGGNADPGMNVRPENQLYDCSVPMIQTQHYSMGMPSGFTLGGADQSSQPQQHHQHMLSISGGNDSFVPVSSHGVQTVPVQMGMPSGFTLGGADQLSRPQQHHQHMLSVSGVSDSFVPVSSQGVQTVPVQIGMPSEFTLGGTYQSSRPRQHHQHMLSVGGGSDSFVPVNSQGVQTMPVQMGMPSGFMLGGAYQSSQPQQHHQHMLSVSGGSDSFVPVTSQDVQPLPVQMGRPSAFRLGGAYQSPWPQQHHHYMLSVSGGSNSFVPVNSQGVQPLHGSNMLPSSSSTYHIQQGNEAPDSGMRSIYNSTAMSGLASYEEHNLQYQQQSQSLFHRQMPAVDSSFRDQGVESNQCAQAPPDRYGLKNLLDVLMSESDEAFLARGIDLSTLGLDLNSTAPLYNTFGSPWSNEPANVLPEIVVPECYNMVQYKIPPLNYALLMKLHLGTLFYIFYSMPRDRAQSDAANELCRRGWFYHREHRRWFRRVQNRGPLVWNAMSEKGSFLSFDPDTWEIKRVDNFYLEYRLIEQRPVFHRH